MTTIKRILLIGAWLTILIAFLLIGVITYWLNCDYNLIEFNNQPFPVLNENLTVKRGDRVTFLVDYCKHTDEIPTITKYFIDGVVLEINTVDGVFEKGCNKMKMDVYIPKAIAPSNYSVEFVGTFHPNPIRTIKYVAKTVNFKVIN